MKSTDEKLVLGVGLLSETSDMAKINQELPQGQADVSAQLGNTALSNSAASFFDYEQNEVNSTLYLSKPYRFREFFDMPLDNTDWSEPEYAQTWDATWTPDRPRADFKVSAALLPRTEQAKTLRAMYGIYIIASIFPKKCIFVGIAPNTGKRPLNIFQHLCRRRIEMTASHVGHSYERMGRMMVTAGQVAHTQHFRHQGDKRYESLKFYNMLPDSLSDVYLMIGESAINTQNELESFRNQILRNEDCVLDAIAHRFWGNDGSNERFERNNGYSYRRADPQKRIVLSYLS